VEKHPRFVFKIVASCSFLDTHNPSVSLEQFKYREYRDKSSIN